MARRGVKKLLGVMTNLLALVGLCALAWAVAFASQGISALPEPSGLEVRAARWGRKLLIPSNARSMLNPIVDGPEVQASARRHFADHCATCHGVDGKGSPLGQRLHPRVPDLTAETQQLTDGEIFHLIEEGVRLTGMPGFGGGDARESWRLVHFIRRLPRLDDAEVDDLKRNQPISRMQLEDELATERFLAGEPAWETEHESH
jgi:mono/diheme cytochrome c family protein